MGEQNKQENKTYTVLDFVTDVMNYGCGFQQFTGKDILITFKIGNGSVSFDDIKTIDGLSIKTKKSRAPLYYFEDGEDYKFPKFRESKIMKNINTKNYIG